MQAGFVYLLWKTFSVTFTYQFWLVNTGLYAQPLEASLLTGGGMHLKHNRTGIFRVPINLGLKEYSMKPEMSELQCMSQWRRYHCSQNPSDVCPLLTAVELAASFALLTVRNALSWITIPSSGAINTHEYWFLAMKLSCLVQLIIIMVTWVYY